MDNTNPTKPDVSTSPDSPKAKPSAIGPDDPNYPKYRLRFEGDSIPGSKPVITGPHTFSALVGGAKIMISVSRNATDHGVPDLTFRVVEG